MEQQIEAAQKQFQHHLPETLYIGTEAPPLQPFILKNKIATIEECQVFSTNNPDVLILLEEIENFGDYVSCYYIPKQVIMYVLQNNCFLTVNNQYLNNPIIFKPSKNTFVGIHVNNPQYGCQQSLYLQAIKKYMNKDSFEQTPI